MSVRRNGRCLPLVLGAFVGAGFLLSGCSQKENSDLEAGVSPFDPRSTAGEKTGLPAGIELPGSSAITYDETKAKNKSKDETAKEPTVGAGVPAQGKLDTTFGADEVAKALRTAMRSARDGEQEKAKQLLDQVLAVEPINREALLARGMLAYEESRKEKSPEARTAAIEKAVGLARALRRAHEPLKASENQFYGAILYSYCHHLAEAHRFADATKALDEVTDVGVEAYFTVAADEKLTELSKSPEYQAALRAHDKARLAAASERVKAQLEKPVGIPFDFSLKDLDDKTVSLADFKGKVVLLDFWGTWCGPCRQIIPGLDALSRNRKSQGLEVVGVNYERDIPERAKAIEVVKAFVKDAKMTYPCLLGDEKTIRQVPDLKGFPTTVIFDRAGQVRALILENDSTTPALIRDVVEVLLAETNPPVAPAVKKPAAAPAKK